MYPKSLEVSAIKYTPDIKNIKVINELLRQFHCSPPHALLGCLQGQCVKPTSFGFNRTADLILSG